MIVARSFVLQGAGQNLARRGAPFVDQHGQLHILGRTSAVGVFSQLLVVAVLRIDDQLPFVQKLVGYADRLIEINRPNCPAGRKSVC